MKELIKQLRDIADDTVSTKIFSACTAAADTIEDLSARAELEEVRAGYNDLCKRLKEVESAWKKDYDQMRKFQAKFIEADQERRALKQELTDEKYRHDRLQDFEVAESEQIARLKAQLAASFDREVKLKKELDRRTTVCFFIGAGR